MAPYWTHGLIRFATLRKKLVGPVTAMWTCSFGSSIEKYFSLSENFNLIGCIDFVLYIEYLQQPDTMSMQTYGTSCRRCARRDAHLNRPCYQIKFTLLAARITNMFWARLKSTIPVLNSWSAAAALNYPRSNFGCAVFRHSIYVIGGRRNHVLIGTIEKYAESIDRWSTVSISDLKPDYSTQPFPLFFVCLRFQIEMTLGVPRSAMCAVVDDEWIYLIGGSDNVETELKKPKHIEKINVIKSTSVQLASMEQSRGDFACVVLPTQW